MATSGSQQAGGDLRSDIKPTFAATASSRAGARRGGQGACVPALAVR